MTTLTITEAKKNLGKWLTAATKGEDVGIINGAQIVALRPVEVEATDYAFREYGLTQRELEAFDTALAAENAKWRRGGKLAPVPNSELRRMLEQAAGSHPTTPKAARRAAKARTR